MRGETHSFPNNSDFDLVKGAFSSWETDFALNCFQNFTLTHTLPRVSLISKNEKLFAFFEQQWSHDGLN